MPWALKRWIVPRCSTMYHCPGCPGDWSATTGWRMATSSNARSSATFASSLGRSGALQRVFDGRASSPEATSTTPVTMSCGGMSRVGMSLGGGVMSRFGGITMSLEVAMSWADVVGGSGRTVPESHARRSVVITRAGIILFMVCSSLCGASMVWGTTLDRIIVAGEVGRALVARRALKGATPRRCVADRWSQGRRCGSRSSPGCAWRTLDPTTLRSRA